jgi:acetoin utilization protein AcuB
MTHLVRQRSQKQQTYESDADVVGKHYHKREVDMKGQLVRDWMTRDPITITCGTTLPEAHRLMMDHSIRRLPVVDDGQLVGIVTLGDIREAEASDATSLSIFELHYLLARLSVSDFMTRDLITVTPTTSMERAAQIMLEHKIGGLPVVERGKLVGIITGSDIFRMLVKGKAA